MRLSSLRSRLLAAVAGFTPLAAALGQQQIISFTGSDGAFQVAGGSISQPQILISSNDYWGVIRAAGDLAKDFGRVTGTNFTLSNGEAGAEPAAYEYRPITTNYTHVSQAIQLYSVQIHKSRSTENIMSLNFNLNRLYSYLSSIAIKPKSSHTTAIC